MKLSIYSFGDIHFVTPDMGMPLKGNEARNCAIAELRGPSEQQLEVFKRMIEANNNREELKAWLKIQFRICNNKQDELPLPEDATPEELKEGYNMEGRMSVLEEMFSLLSKGKGSDNEES